MTPSQFEHTAARMKHSPRVREACRRVLVDGVALTDAAADAGMGKPHLSRACASIRARWEVLQRAPVDWVTVTVRVPRDVAAQIKAMARKARQERPRLPRGRPRREAQGDGEAGAARDTAETAAATS